MRRLMTPLTLLSSLILFACTVPTATALPQSVPQQVQTAPWSYISPIGDTVVGRLVLPIVVVDTVAPRRVNQTISVTDTLYCVSRPAPGCSKAPPILPLISDTVVPRPPAVGIPFMITNLFRQSAGQPDWGPGPFTASINSDAPAVLLPRISAARALRHRLVVMMTGGGKKNYTVEGTDPGTFSLAKWKERQDLFNTPQFKAAIAAGVADGTVVGANMLDEPQHIGWKNSITKATLDSMAVYLKTIFPTLPVGVSLKTSWRPTERLRKVDFIVTQWVEPWGAVDKWRDSELGAAKLDGVAIVFSFNALNGGAGFSETACPFGFGEKGSTTGTFRCQMSPAQIREVALALAPYGCALNVWEFRPELVSSAEKLSAFRDVAALTASLPAKPCRRSA
jgi:hypothetical protein